MVTSDVYLVCDDCGASVHPDELDPESPFDGDLCHECVSVAYLERAAGV